MLGNAIETKRWGRQRRQQKNSGDSWFSFSSPVQHNGEKRNTSDKKEVYTDRNDKTTRKRKRRKKAASQRYFPLERAMVVSQQVLTGLFPRRRCLRAGKTRTRDSSRQLRVQL